MADNDYPEIPEMPELSENFTEIAEATQERLAVLAANGVLKAIEKLNQPVVTGLCGELLVDMIGCSYLTDYLIFCY